MTQSFSAPAGVWVGRFLSLLTVLVLVADGGSALVVPDSLATQMAETGFPATMVKPLGIIILLCALLYAVPRTAFLGAILITAFAGGAVATHFRLGEIGSPPQLISIAISCVAWLGLLLRDNRLRALMGPAAPHPAR